MNPKALNLVTNANEWDSVRREFATLQGWTPDQIEWGTGPGEYPAMVCFYVPTAFKVVACYVYPKDAVELAKAAGFRVYLEGVTGPVGPMSHPGPAGPSFTEQQEAFNRHLAAQQLSLVQVLIDKGLTTREAWEKKLVANLAVVDRWQTTDREKLRGVVDGVSVLDGMYPTTE